MTEQNIQRTVEALLAQAEAVQAFHRASVEQVRRFESLAQRIEQALQAQADKDSVRRLGRLCVALHEARSVIGDLRFESNESEGLTPRLAGDDMSIEELVDAGCARLTRADELLRDIESRIEAEAI